MVERPSFVTLLLPINEQKQEVKESRDCAAIIIERYCTNSKYHICVNALQFSIETKGVRTIQIHA